MTTSTNLWISLNKKKIDDYCRYFEALKLKGEHEDINFSDLIILIRGMEREIDTLQRALGEAQKENEQLHDLFTKDDKE